MSRHAHPVPARLAAAAVLAAALLAVAAGPAAAAAPVHPGPPITIQRATGPITVDGKLDDAGWKGITPITTWYETKVSDNGEPPVKNTGWLAYDDHYLYAAFQFDDPHPELIRAPIADHDQLSGTTDYGGLMIDSNNDGKSAIEFLANANGLQYDAVNNDASGEDSSPDYYWDSAGRITATGWTLEIRIPFTSLRYARVPSPTWGVMLYRNYPRERHYQFFTNRIPRNSSCFVCTESSLLGLDDPPQSSNIVLAPYTSAQRTDQLPANGPGSPLVAGEVKSEAGADVKWSPLASLAVDATIHPDFSQVESDVAQIAANERFALFYPEKRSFFLEGIDLFATPLQAVYTRSITSPSVGGRVTGRDGNTSFTALVAHDRGQGLVILPGPMTSDFAPQDFTSDVGIVRVRHDLGPSSVSFLTTARNSEGGAHNMVFGPDARWQPRPEDVFTAQALWSDDRTPNRPDLATEWDGRTLQDRALLARWSHNSKTTDVFLQGQDLGREFRADEGFIPQVGYREIYFESGYTLRSTKAFFSRLRLFTIEWYDGTRWDRADLNDRISVGAGADGRWNSFTRVELNRDEFVLDGRRFVRFRPYLDVQASPSRMVDNLQLQAYVGDEIDFANARKGSGTTLSGSVVLHAGNHLEVAPNVSTRWLHVDDAALGSGRLFLAQIERLRTTWSFSSHAFVRLVGQYQQTTRDPALYDPAIFTSPVPAKDARFDDSALVAYKLNWQTVVYAGYGDDRTLNNPDGKLVPGGREVFAKVSYAIQR